MSSLRDTVARALAAYFENDADAYEAWLVEAAVALAAIREQWAIVPREPEPERIESMCIRFDHSHGIKNWFAQLGREETDEEFAKRQEGHRRTMRQLYEEATGQGFYSERTKDDPLYAAAPGRDT